jgi:hypothetical protein
MVLTDIQLESHMQVNTYAQLDIDVYLSIQTLNT